MHIQHSRDGHPVRQKTASTAALPSVKQYGAPVAVPSKQQGTGLHDYDNENQVTPVKKGKHIWGKNNVTPSGNMNDNEVPLTEMLFGYDTSLTARACINRTTKNKVHYTQQSLPYDSFHRINMDQLQHNAPLFGTMMPTVRPQPPQVFTGYDSGEEYSGMQMRKNCPINSRCTKVCLQKQNVWV